MVLSDDLLGFPHQPVFAMLGSTLVHFAEAILESLNFAVNVYERVYILLIDHGVSPLLTSLLSGQ
jgi:hypothetical protein